MQALKGLVIGLGLTIVLVMGLIVWGLYKKSEDPDFKMFSFSSAPSDEAKTPAGPAPAALPTIQGKPWGKPWGTQSLGLPPGCEIAHMAVDQGRLFLHTRPVGGGTQPGCAGVTIVDPASGTVIGRIDAGN